MLRWAHLVSIGFLLFVGVTVGVARAGHDPQTVRLLVYAVVAGYGLGLVGMTITLVESGNLGKLVLALFVALGTGAIAAVAVLSQYSFSVALPF